MHSVDNGNLTGFLLRMSETCSWNICYTTRIWILHTNIHWVLVSAVEIHWINTVGGQYSSPLVIWLLNGLSPVFYRHKVAPYSRFQLQSSPRNSDWGNVEVFWQNDYANWRIRRPTWNLRSLRSGAAGSAWIVYLFPKYLWGSFQFQGSQWAEWRWKISAGGLFQFCQ